MRSMLKRPWMLQAVLPVAHRGVAVAQEISPVGTPGEDPHPGEYRAMWKVEYGLKNKKFRGQPGWRHTATIVNRSPHSRIVEYGNGKTPEYGIARDTIDILKVLHGGS
jgi:hypothetical protein